MEIGFILVGFYINFLKVEAKLLNHKNTMIECGVNIISEMSLLLLQIISKEADWMLTDNSWRRGGITSCNWIRTGDSEMFWLYVV